MKKHAAIAIILGLVAAAAFGQTAKLTKPALGSSWAIGTTQAILWTHSGKALVRLVLFNPSGAKAGIIKSKQPLDNGSFPWSVGKLENGQVVPPAKGYTIQLKIDGTDVILSSSGPFEIASAQTTPPAPPPAGNPQFMTITQVAVIPPQPKTATPIVVSVTHPAKGIAWTPLKTNFSVKWEWSIPIDATDRGGWFPNCGGCPVDVWIVPTAAPSQKIPLKKNICCGQGPIKNGIVTYAGQYQGIAPNLASGDHVVRVSWTNKPGFYGDSQPFAVKSTLSENTAFLGPDPAQGQVDLALTKVFFDGQGNLMMKIKNMGAPFSGSIVASYEILFQVYGQLMDKGKVESQFSAQAYEEKNVLLKEWGGYTFNTDIHSKGKYIPYTTRPVAVKARITGNNDINPNNDWVNQEICMIQDADIGTDGEIKLAFSPKAQVYINRGTRNEIHEAQLKWLSENTFEAEMEVVLWNYGAVKKSFDIWLYVDELPGQLLFGGTSLLPGYKTTWKRLVEIKVPSRCGNHRLVFIADPAEAKNQPYPNSYMNNSINATLKIACGGTITGSN